MKYIVDIDDTICVSPNTEDGKRDYPNAVPLYSRIDKINALYDAGHEIHYWTARGGTTGKDWSNLTTKQLKEWGVRYTSLKMKKPAYDKWIDDKAINADDL